MDQNAQLVGWRKKDDIVRTQKKKRAKRIKETKQKLLWIVALQFAKQQQKKEKHCKLRLQRKRKQPTTTKKTKKGGEDRWEIKKEKRTQ